MVNITDYIQFCPICVQEMSREFPGEWRCPDCEIVWSIAVSNIDNKKSPLTRKDPLKEGSKIQVSFPAIERNS
jgi:hypothetical protein